MNSLIALKKERLVSKEVTHERSFSLFEIINQNRLDRCLYKFVYE
jgi:hypothetical protein